MGLPSPWIPWLTTFPDGRTYGAGNHLVRIRYSGADRINHLNCSCRCSDSTERSVPVPEPQPLTGTRQSDGGGSEAEGVSSFTSSPVPRHGVTPLCTLTTPLTTRRWGRRAVSVC
jgi:hypothetical protein